MATLFYADGRVKLVLLRVPFVGQNELYNGQKRGNKKGPVLDRVTRYHPAIGAQDDKS
jgi:hypothetical protein